MKIVIILTIVIITVLFIGRNFLYSAKKSLFRDQASWSGKDIKIKYSGSREVSKSKENDNYLKIIADESEVYLEDHSNKEENQIK